MKVILIASLILASLAFAQQTVDNEARVINGNLTVNGAIYSPTIGNILYVDDTTITSIASAFALCSSQQPCIIHAEGADQAAAKNFGVFDPGSTNVTLYLGPQNYVGEIILRNNLTVIGQYKSTQITQINASTPVIALPTSGAYPGIVAAGVRIENLTLNPAASSTADAISLVAAPNGSCSPQPACQATNPGGGMWYGTFDHIYINPGFGRNGIRIDGTQAGNPTSVVQFASFRDVYAFRKTNGLPALAITGTFTGQITFDDCQFDGQFGGQDTTAGLSNISIDDTPGQGAATWIPYTLTFTNLTSQFANGNGGAAVRIKGVSSVTFVTPHFELDLGIISAVIGPGGHGSWSITVVSPYMSQSSQARLFSGVTAGTGFIYNTDGHSAITQIDGGFVGTPDNFVTGAAGGEISWLGNFQNLGNGLLQPVPGITVSALPPATAAIGKTRTVTDSTAIAAEGQVCTGGSSNVAMAWSNGTVWKCF